MSNDIEYFEIEDAGDDVIACRIHGKFSAESMSDFIDRVERIRDAGGKARVFLDATGYDTVEMGAAKEKLARMGTLWGHIERVAYLVDKTWLGKVIGFVDAITPMHLRAFGPDDQAEAVAWLLSPDDQ